jgi:hypothetical protein
LSAVELVYLGVSQLVYLGVSQMKRRAENFWGFWGCFIVYYQRMEERWQYGGFKKLTGGIYVR